MPFSSPGPPPVAEKLIVISPPGRHVQRGGFSLPVHEMLPVTSLHLPPTVPSTERIDRPGGGTQSKLLMKPIPLVFCPSSWYLPLPSQRRMKTASVVFFACVSESIGGGPGGAAADANGATDSASATTARIPARLIRPV